MADATLDTILRQLRRLAGAGDSGRLSDGELLGRFVRTRDQGAFEVLVWRHGPMVLGVCRRLARREQDAEDAFQASFLALARKAHTVSKCASVGSWLYKVAWRAARAVRERSARHEPRAAPAEPSGSAGAEEVLWRDLRPVLDEEVGRLPEKYRAPVVLCYLEGKSNEEAARQLGCPPNTLAVRLLRARERLRAGLTRRGLAPTAAVLAGVLSEKAAQAVSASLVDATVSTAPAFAAGQAVATAAPAVSLAQGVLRTMFLSQVRRGAVAAVAALAVVLAGVMTYQHLTAASPEPTPAAQQPRPAQQPVAKADEVAAVAAGNNRFAFDLQAELGKKPGNLFFSPYSISTALGMTYAGARGDTAKEMASVLHYTLPPERLHPALAGLANQVAPEGKKRPVELRVANALWGQHDYPFLKEFTDLMRDNYGAGLRLVDYKGSTEAARKAINAWVENQTQDRIKELLKPGILDQDTRLVLTNAIYFLGTWARPFDKKQTRDADFDTGGGKKVKVPMMHQDNRFRHFASERLQGLELFYKGDEVSMVVLLPREGVGLAEVEQGLKAGKLPQWLKQMQQSRVMVSLPRFEITGEFAMKPTLEAMGMTLAFTPRKADLSGMDGSYRLYIKEVVHKAFVKVDEVGTEAAAATAVVINEESLPPQFRADRPFVFLIRDVRSGSVLFVGRVTDPTTKG